MAEWKLQTPYGVINCKKGRSYGEKTWRKPETKKYGSVYQDGQGHPLQRDVYGKVGNQWVPAKGNDKFAKRVFHKDWVAQGKPKTIEGRKLGLVVKRVKAEGGRTSKGVADLVFDAREEVKISKIELKRFVSKDMKYVLPLRDSYGVYQQVVRALNDKGGVLVTKPVQISKNSAAWYVYAVVPVGRYLVLCEILDRELEKEFPPDALIPADRNEEVGAIQEESVEGLI